MYTNQLEGINKRKVASSTIELEVEGSSIQFVCRDWVGRSFPTSNHRMGILLFVRLECQPQLNRTLLTEPIDCPVCFTLLSSINYCSVHVIFINILVKDVQYQAPCYAGYINADYLNHGMWVPIDGIVLWDYKTHQKAQIRLDDDY